MDVGEVIAKSRNFADDVDKLRSEWESRTHWQVRKTFLLRNWDDFNDKDRLICLSQAWFNSRFHGNTYPSEVMEVMKDMEDGMEPMEKMLRDAEMQVIGICDHRPTKVKNIHDTSKLPNTFYPMRFVKQNENSQSSESSNELKTDKDSTLKPNVLSLENNNYQPSMKKLKLTQTDDAKVEPSVSCELQSSSDTPPREIKPISFENVKNDEIVLSQDSLKKLENLIFRRTKETSAIGALISSADFCKLSREYVFEQHYGDQPTAEYSCSIYINGVLVGKARAESKKTAKHAAAHFAMELLEKTRPTILVTANPGDLDSALSRDDISASSKGKNDKIQDSNLGNQLLRKMGWSGEGGLGKTGSGISAPVTVTESCHRAGLGSESDQPNLLSFKDAHDVIRNYAASESSDVLTFSPELTNEERAKIHKFSRRYGLKSKSYNKGDIRYLVVSRRISAADLVNQLKSSGGKKGNVQLIVPGGVPACDSAS